MKALDTKIREAMDAELKDIEGRSYDREFSGAAQMVDAIRKVLDDHRAEVAAAVANVDSRDVMIRAVHLAQKRRADGWPASHERDVAEDIADAYLEIIAEQRAETLAAHSPRVVEALDELDDTLDDLAQAVKTANHADALAACKALEVDAMHLGQLFGLRRRKTLAEIAVDRLAKESKEPKRPAPASDYHDVEPMLPDNDQAVATHLRRVAALSDPDRDK